VAAGPNAPSPDAAASHAAKTAALAAAGDAAGLGRRLGALKADPALGEAERERLLRSTLLELASLKADRDTRALAAAYQEYPSTAVVWRDDHGHPEPVRLHDVGAAARFALRRWAETDARDETLAALARADADTLVGYGDVADAASKGMAEAFAEAPVAHLAAQRPALLAALDAGRPVGGPALTAAARLADPELYVAVLRRADARTALDAVRRLDDGPDQLDALALLIEASNRPDIASAALLALGRRATADPAAAAALFDHIGGPHGASAAAALARHGDERTLERLATILRADGGERQRRHALLALRLSATPRAEALLAAFAADAAMPVTLREEVPGWLRD
jgi:hypothetical protein